MARNVLDELGNRIRELRIGKDMTQQELAEKSELSLPFINLIENNKRNVSLETLVKLLKVLEVSLSDFFLPYSQENDEHMAFFLSLLQQSPNKEQLVDLFIQFLMLSEK
ncbi:helix-turn-helix transcriptional regulator [Enterococcus sp.]|uniref:helix-turn-helix domain-containing protein n=1 Tax=Enterococcus sp. TaxID=35783 RepID=UPI00290852B3|nr:helix-turn-helix transcriptional regulator [Enterococcus sp.]MDU5337176.1 helix-turn-helix transcriptional regulator [Enterococcus sp.]